MKKFLIKVFVFSFLLCVILSGTAQLVDAGLSNSEVDNFKEWNDIYQGKINADLIILGSSRAWVHVSPYILDTALHLDSYNLGIDGHRFDIQHCRYRLFESRNKKPSYIVHCLDVQTLTATEALFMPEQFAPYLSDSIIASGVKGYDGYSAIDFWNPFTKYYNKPKYVGIGLMEFFSIRHYRSTKYKGYKPKLARWDNKFERARKRNPNGIAMKVDPETLDNFKRYLTRCASQGIQVLLVYPPEYVEINKLVTNRQEIFEMYQRIASEFQVPFLDYRSDSLCYRKEYFYNTTHLNKEGAELFSAKLAMDLRPYIQSDRLISR